MRNKKSTIYRLIINNIIVFYKNKDSRFYDYCIGELRVGECKRDISDETKKSQSVLSKMVDFFKLQNLKVLTPKKNNI